MFCVVTFMFEQSSIDLVLLNPFYYLQVHELSEKLVAKH